MKRKEVCLRPFRKAQGGAEALPVFASGYGEVVVLVRNDRKLGENRIAVRFSGMLPRRSEDERNASTLGYLVRLG